METVLIWSFGAKCIAAVLAVLLLYGLLRLWNHLSGSRFDEAHSKMVGEPLAAGLYYGLRFVAFALLVGFLLA